MLEHVTLKSFAPHVDEKFVLKHDGGDVDLVLVEATDKTTPGVPGEQFSLLFRGPLRPALAQHIYTLDHPEMGGLELFLVPVAEKESGRLYEAFFNRSVKSEV